jgi:hypothetical protein
LALHWVGGIPITPYHIWRYIPQNVALNVDTWLYDIVYGTGPWILLDRQPGVQMTMIPFRKGNSYRLITLQNSFFYQVIRPPEDENDAEGIIGRNVYFINELHNYGTTAITVTVEFDYDIWYYNATTGTWGPTTPALGPAFAASQQYTIQPGETKRIVNPKVATIPAKYPFCTWFAIHDSMHWTYTAFNHVWQGFYGDFTGHTPEEPAYWSDLVHYHPGDHFGKTPAPAPGDYWDMLNDYSERYLAANGLVNIGDVGPITANWQQPAPATLDIGINDANGIKKRADMDGNNIIAIGDVGLITANWQKTWTETPALNVTGTIHSPVSSTVAFKVLNVHPGLPGTPVTRQWVFDLTNVGTDSDTYTTPILTAGTHTLWCTIIYADGTITTAITTIIVP